jgi:hypothetical protein
MRTQTKAGIILPDNAIIDPQLYGRVESVGPDVDGIGIGDILTYHPQAARVVVFNRLEYHIVVFDEVYGKLVDPEIIEQLDDSKPLIPAAERDKPLIQTLS